MRTRSNEGGANGAGASFLRRAEARLRKALEDVVVNGGGNSDMADLDSVYRLGAQDMPFALQTDSFRLAEPGEEGEDELKRSSYGESFGQKEIYGA